MKNSLKLFNAIVWANNESLGARAEYWAESSDEVRAFIKAQFGEGATFTLHNEADATKVRKPAGAMSTAQSHA